jgi:hypothetical protein
LCLPISGIKPNFDEQTLNLDVFVHGKLSLWDILWPLLGYVIRQPIRPIALAYCGFNKNKSLNRKGDASE